MIEFRFLSEYLPDALSDLSFVGTKEPFGHLITLRMAPEEDRLYLTAFDGGIKARSWIEAFGKESVVCSVSRDALARIATSLPTVQVQAKVSQRGLNMSWGSGRQAELPISPNDNDESIFFELGAVDQWVHLPAEIRHMTYMLGAEALDHLNIIGLVGELAVSTDGFRMSHLKVPQIVDEGQISIPLSLTRAFSKSVQMGLLGDKIALLGEAWQAVSPQATGFQFDDRFIKKTDPCSEPGLVDRRDFTAKLSAVLANGHEALCVLAVNQRQLHIFATGDILRDYHEVIPISGGDGFVCHSKAAYLLQALGQFPKEVEEIELQQWLSHKAYTKPGKSPFPATITLTHQALDHQIALLYGDFKEDDHVQAALARQAEIIADVLGQESLVAA